MSRGRDLTIAGIALGIAVVAGVAALVIFATTRSSSTTSAGGVQGKSPATAGEIIFRTGRDPNGQPIPRTGSSGGMMGGGMMAAGCATCHGSDGHGRTTTTFSAPNITYSNLTDSAGMLQPDGSRGPTYTDAALRRAITQGIDPQGARLQQPMPQWQLTNTEWADLLAYLKTLR